MEMRRNITANVCFDIVVPFHTTGGLTAEELEERCLPGSLSHLPQWVGPFPTSSGDYLSSPVFSRLYIV